MPEQLEHDGREGCSTASTTIGLSAPAIRHRVYNVLDWASRDFEGSGMSE
jgi:hypothetical protein